MELEAGERQNQWCRTTFGEGVKTTFTWTIDNFKNRPEKFGEKITSSPFFVTDSDNRVTKWCFNVYPKGRQVMGEDKEGVCVYLVNTNEFPMKASWDGWIIDKNAGIVNKSRVVQEAGLLVMSGGQGLGGLYLKLNDLTESLLPGGNLTLVFEVRVYGKGKTVSGSKDSDNNNILPEDERRKEVCDHFGQMLADKEFSDMEIHCDGTVFPCHQTILAARSPVFRAMLQAEMKEKQTKTINIEDSNPDTISEMLKFIYTGDITGKKLPDMAGDLLRMADKYELESLRKMCEARLCSTLKAENSIELLVLGDLYHTPKLKKRALDLVAMNMKKIVDTDVYKDLLRQKPDLAWEVIKVKTLEAEDG